MAVLGVVLAVGHHDDGGAIAVELGKQVHYLIPVAAVEVPGGLVGQDEFRVVHHGPGHGHTLLLPARELLREVLAPVHDLHLLEHRFYPLFALGGFDPGIDERQLHILVHGELVDQVEALEDKADVVLAQVGPLALVEAGHFNAVELEAAAVWVVEQADNVQQGRFATSGGPHHGNELPFLHLEGKLVQGNGAHLFGAVEFFKVFYFYHDVRISCVHTLRGQAAPI